MVKDDVFSKGNSNKKCISIQLIFRWVNINHTENSFSWSSSFPNHRESLPSIIDAFPLKGSCHGVHDEWTLPGSVYTDTSGVSHFRFFSLKKIKLTLRVKLS